MMASTIAFHFITLCIVILHLMNFKPVLFHTATAFNSILHPSSLIVSSTLSTLPAPFRPQRPQAHSSTSPNLLFTTEVSVTVSKFSKESTARARVAFSCMFIARRNFVLHSVTTMGQGLESDRRERKEKEQKVNPSSRDVCMSTASHVH